MSHPRRFLDVEGRHCVLDREVRRQTALGWSVVERTATEVTFRHEAVAPWWWAPVSGVVSVLLVPMTAVFGPIPVERWPPPLERTLHVRYRGHGAVSRRSTGGLPRGWSRASNWEVPDGVVRPPPS